MVDNLINEQHRMTDLYCDECSYNKLHRGDIIIISRNAGHVRCFTDFVQIEKMLPDKSFFIRAECIIDPHKELINPLDPEADYRFYRKKNMSNISCLCEVCKFPLKQHINRNLCKELIK